MSRIALPLAYPAARARPPAEILVRRADSEAVEEAEEEGCVAECAHSAHVSPLDLGSVKDIYLCRPLGGSNRNYSGPRSGLAHDLHIRLKQYPRVSAAVGRFNAAGAPAPVEGEFVAFYGDRGGRGGGGGETG